MNAGPKIDTWVWGRERIIWGFDPSHQYTFKILEPKVGRDGCMSLQYHDYKSETWLMLRGEIWALFALDGQVCTKIMRPGDGQNIITGVIHRMMGLTGDAQVAEPSTPDRHAADKSAPKDVVRLHCVHGREVVKGRTAEEQRLVELSIQYSEEAIKCVESGQRPPEHQPEFLEARGAFRIC